MNSRITDKLRNKIKPLAAVIAALLLSLIVMTGIFMSSSRISMAEGEDGRKDITIEVVEDIPAEDIEEAEVPMAALPDSPVSNGVRHMGMMLILLAGVIAYAVYFTNYEKKLVSLRAQAAEAEARAMQARRNKKETDK